MSLLENLRFNGSASQFLTDPLRSALNSNFARDERNGDVRILLVRCCRCCWCAVVSPVARRSRLSLEGEREKRAFVDWRDEREAAICLAILAKEKRREGARREEMRRGKRKEEGDGRSERESSPAMVELLPVLTDGGGSGAARERRKE
ncbi:hypothetical protein KY290_011014 [Solanum tuberosum]|uniref:Uncharacterized protein n=1 Tax=Solanum tuberosum TaxID=4113 RepID=A0ABQ7VZE5_SOLTU|nr:hypothetical protein KY290_011014 [Solanum tuberosum]